jgi:hypothetical protein
MMAKLISLLCLASLAVAMPNNSGVISSSLLSLFGNQEKANVALVFSRGVQPAYNSISGQTFTQRGQKMTILREELISYTSAAQSSLRSFLQDEGADFKSFWITNRIIVRNADAAVYCNRFLTTETVTLKLSTEVKFL